MLLYNEIEHKLECSIFGRVEVIFSLTLLPIMTGQAMIFII